MAATQQTQQRFGTTSLQGQSYNFQGVQDNQTCHTGFDSSNNVLHGPIALGGSQFNITQLSLTFAQTAHDPFDYPKFRWNIPRPVNSQFVGRNAVMSEIKGRLCCETQPQKVFVITGMGGIGKSEIFLRLMDELRDQ